MTRNSGIEYQEYPIPFFMPRDDDYGNGYGYGYGNGIAPINLRRNFHPQDKLKEEKKKESLVSKKAEFLKQEI